MPDQLLVPLDGSTLADAAIPVALDLARRLDAELLLVRVHVPVPLPSDPTGMALIAFDPEVDLALRTEASIWIREKGAQLERASGVKVATELRAGDPADEIVATASDRKVKAIVCCTHGVGGLAPHWIGSVADAVIRHATCPVLALPPEAPARTGTLRTILVPLDGSGESDAILPHAAWAARAFDAEVELLSVVLRSSLTDIAQPHDDDRYGIDVRVDATKARLDALAAELRVEGVRARSTVEVGANPARVILGHIARVNPDIVALATHGRGLSRLIVGSTADKVLRTSGRPALMFRPPAGRNIKGGGKPRVARRVATQYVWGL